MERTLVEVGRAPGRKQAMWGDKKLASTVGKLRFFRGLPDRLLTAEGINLCGNFRQKPNAERSGYYISPAEVGEGVVYPLADTAETLMAASVTHSRLFRELMSLKFAGPREVIWKWSSLQSTVRRNDDKRKINRCDPLDSSLHFD